MIRVHNLAKYFGEVRAVDHVTFELQEGDSVVIHGPSGSGKTTLLRLIAGLEMPDDGEVHINGTLVSEAGRVVAPHVRGIGFMFQTPALWPHMTVAQNILFGLGRLTRDAARQRLEELMEQTSLPGLERRYPAQLSGGQARRVALARTLAPKPRILLMDEPLTHIDPELKASLLRLLKETVRREGTSLLYVTHDIEEAAQIGEGRPLEMRNGRLIDEKAETPS